MLALPVPMFQISCFHDIHLHVIPFFFSEMALQTISESVYVGLCFKIGTPQQVAISRDVADIK